MTAPDWPRTDAQSWAQLIGAIAAEADTAAFAALFAHFAPRVKALMRRSGASDEVAEELAQEAMLRVWRKAASFDPASNGAAAWIFTIARNLRIDSLRRNRGPTPVGLDEIDTELLRDEAPLPDVALESRQDEARVRRALSQLPPDQLNVIELSFYQAAPHARIAELLGIPLGTVKSRLRLAAVKLRSLLDLET